MKFFKKAKELFTRLTKSDDTPPKKVETVSAGDILPVLFEDIPEYQKKQRDFRARARATRIRWNSMNRALGGKGTCNLGRNKAKRAGRAAALAAGASPRVAKRKQQNWIEVEA